MGRPTSVLFTSPSRITSQKVHATTSDRFRASPPRPMLFVALTSIRNEDVGLTTTPGNLSCCRHVRVSPTSFEPPFISMARVVTDIGMPVGALTGSYPSYSVALTLMAPRNVTGPRRLMSSCRTLSDWWVVVCSGSSSPESSSSSKSMKSWERGGCCWLVVWLWGIESVPWFGLA